MRRKSKQMVGQPSPSLDADAEELGGYRAISPLAPVVLLLGIGSLLALIHPLLWCVPFIAVVLAILGLRKIARNSDLIGRTGILIGLALALFLGAVAPSRMISRNWMLARESRRIAQAWLELIRDGDLQEAHQWTLSPYERSQVSPLSKHYESREALIELDEFFDRPSMKRFVAAAQDGDIQFTGQQHVVRDGGTDQMVQPFVVVQTDNSQLRENRFRAVLKRTIDRKTGKAYWHIDGLSDVDTF